MRNLLLLLLITTFYSCEKEDNPIVEEIPKKALSNLVGTWIRIFDANGNEHTATYNIFMDSIQFDLNGVVGVAKYTMLKNSYNQETGKWIGHTLDNKFYLLFFKGVIENKLTFYKQETADLSEAQMLEIPSDDTEENYGWLEYEKE